MLIQQGRSFLHPPHDIPGVSLTTEQPPERCFLPKRLIHEWSNAHARGVAAIRLFPKSGHLLLSAGMDSKIKVSLLSDTSRQFSLFLSSFECILALLKAPKLPCYALECVHNLNFFIISLFTPVNNNKKYRTCDLQKPALIRHHQQPIPINRCGSIA